ncbi:helix-turn-helix transcriptional regulator [Acrocarpospora catenulata]|uniref:helix-turn-helix transcriptional regulator n=1 Tax=Acrocarpospora catenulata TaxID=2836182 RepID=UPI001BD98105|nr:YafY family protein [Acrocarpospora catenulata]
MSTNRVLALLELLQARPGLTGPELAARLAVDERTVRRYAARLTDLGVPVEADRGRYGGYRLSPGYRLPPLMLTEDEAAAVVLGLLVGRHSGVAAGTESALAKIERVLPRGLRERVRAVEETVGLTSRRFEGRASGSVLLSLAEAVRGSRRVRVAYRSFGGRVSEREVDPYGLVFHSGRWYVTGFDHARGEVRTFRVDRVGALEVLGEGFEAPEEFDPVAAVMDGLARVPYRYEVEVVVHAEPAEVRRRLPASLAVLTEVESGVRLVARVERLEGMAQALAGLGWPFTVVRPAELRVAVAELAERLRSWAGEPDPDK